MPLKNGRPTVSEIRKILSTDPYAMPGLRVGSVWRNTSREVDESWDGKPAPLPRGLYTLVRYKDGRVDLRNTEGDRTNFAASRLYRPGWQLVSAK